MIRDIHRFSQYVYDLLIIGGGINGAAIANLAAGHGLTVALIEKGDFASGTSSKTTKLLHGGIRYLENFEFDLVKESLQERIIQMKAAPHLVKPLSFVIPVYKNDRRPLWMMKFGVTLYDFLGGEHSIGKHRFLNPSEVKGEIPDIETQGLQGGVTYFDAQMNDARLCLENGLMAHERGVHITNYVEALSFLKENEKVIGIKAKGLIRNIDFEIKAKNIICALGPWTNTFSEKNKDELSNKVRTTKGVHIVYKGNFSKNAVLVTNRDDKRIFFVIPWQGNSLIGTTDTDFKGSPDSVTTEKEDVAYLLREVKRVFPTVDIKEENIITTFAGLRPLVSAQGSPSKISRKHGITRTKDGVFWVAGGKYTTYRVIAMDCLKMIYGRTFPFLEEFMLYGSGLIEESSQELARHYGLEEEIVDHLKNTYGTRYSDVLKLTKQDPSWKSRICACSPAIAAQVVYAIKFEMAFKDEDIIWRRLSLGYLNCPTRQCFKQIEALRKRFIK